ncbi:MAG: glutathione S-transferase family protein [Pseudomonadota bacterium]
MASGLTLYHAAYSTCSQKVRLTLAEKRITFTSREISFARQEQLDPEYLAINPNGVVPTLVHDGAIITESSAIVEYLDEVFPEVPLTPADPVERAHMRAWLRFMEEVPTKAVRVPSFEKVFLPSLRLIKGTKAFQKDTDMRTVRQGFYGKMNQGKGFSVEDIREADQHLSLTVERIEAALQNGPWIMGTQLTLADLTLAPLIDRMLDLGCDAPFQKAEKTLAWMDRLQTRPAYAEAFYKNTRLSERTEFQYARLRNWVGSKLLPTKHTEDTDQ